MKQGSQNKYESISGILCDLFDGAGFSLDGFLLACFPRAGNCSARTAAPLSVTKQPLPNRQSLPNLQSLLVLLSRQNHMLA